jgi:hypothetical protein
VTEEEWLACEDSLDMLLLIRRHSRSRHFTSRKLRLFGLACCHRVRRLLTPERGHVLLRHAERLADDDPSAQERTPASILDGLRFESRDPHDEADVAVFYLLNESGLTAADEGLRRAAAAIGWEARREGKDAILGREAERREQAHLAQDIFGNPFRPVSADPRWCTSSVVGLAQSMYESRDFAAMPVLADALEEAGCDHADVLAHCRGGGPHVRGCWVVDLLLGKS